MRFFPEHCLFCAAAQNLNFFKLFQKSLCRHGRYSLAANHISMQRKSQHTIDYLKTKNAMWQVVLDATSDNLNNCYLIRDAHNNMQLRFTLLIMVVRSPPFSSGFWASPTLDGSLRAFSLENVLHSEPTSITRSPEEQAQDQFLKALSPT